MIQLRCGLYTFEWFPYVKNLLEASVGKEVCISDIERKGEPMSNKIYLVLENGDVFEGKSFGAPVKEDSPVIGELVFRRFLNSYFGFAKLPFDLK